MDHWTFCLAQTLMEVVLSHNQKNMKDTLFSLCDLCHVLRFENLEVPTTNNAVDMEYIHYIWKYNCNLNLANKKYKKVKDLTH